VTVVPIQNGSRWAGVWADALAFVAGLGVAWFAGWRTTDLVWSLWLSSLVVGYALIVWNLSAPLREFAGNATRDTTSNAALAKLGIGGVLTVVLLFGLAFFTVHFGGFHYVHSVFLNSFFPLNVPAQPRHGFPNLAAYLEVVRRYWIFLPVAFLAERDAFRSGIGFPDTAVTAGASTQRKRVASGGGMMEPYKNVMRMHLLIFFFAAAHFLRLENFLVYAVVYAVYFFPWRLLRSNPAARNDVGRSA